MKSRCWGKISRYLIVLPINFWGAAVFFFVFSKQGGQAFNVLGRLA